jgi:hypothetical protein
MAINQYASNQALRTRHARRMRDVDYGSDEGDSRSQYHEPLNQPDAPDRSIKSSPGRLPARAEEKTARPSSWQKPPSRN